MADGANAGSVAGSRTVTVVSVINYKGGVGKTTLTANLGAELAARGQKILLVDLDPQASLTFGFYQPDIWEKELADEKTILQWFGASLDSGKAPDLASFVVTPKAAKERVKASHPDGQLDLLASHLGLVDVDLDFAAELGGSRFQHGSPRFVPLLRLLADALAGPSFAHYDLILIDCAPNFTMVTRTGIVASDYLLVPSKADYISTIGISYLRRKLSELERDYNRVASAVGAPAISPTILGVVFTMVQVSRDDLIGALRPYVEQVRELELRVLSHSVRENKTTFASSGLSGIPVVLDRRSHPSVLYELEQIALELRALVRT